ncbi:MAG: hypothetical protein II954_03430, partial [Synergistaceae bacterium]|nr:hypothetical protein [Synergistaceae bacterium]
PFFKSILNKQVEWARTQRGIRLEFEELAEAVRKELLKVGIHTMAESKKESKTERETSSLFEGTESGEAIHPQTLHLRADDNFAELILWLQGVIDTAIAEKYTGLELTAKITKEALR